MRRWGRALSFSVLVIGVLVLAAVGPAIAAPGKLVVEVYEVDKQGESTLLPGAQVVLTDANGQVPQMAQTTNGEGIATFGVVPAGRNYVVTVKFPGMATTRQDGIQVFSERTTRIGIGLKPERIEEVEVVGREQVIELEKGGQTETEVSGEFFQDLPVQGREYQNILELAAGVQDLDDDGNPNVHGARATEFQMNVDGISNVDPLTGEFQSRINADAIEELRIVDSGADASYGGAGGGYGQIITKSGGNEFEGSFNFFFRDDAFDNDRAGGTDPLDFGIINPSIYLSGPVVKDHLWYMASHELVDEEYPVDLIGGTDFVIDATRLINRDKITWQVTPKNKLQLQYSSDPWEAEPLAVNSVRPPETGVTYERSGPSFTLTWTAPFSPTFFWEATLGYSNINIDYDPFAPGNRNTCINPDQNDTVFENGGRERWLTMMCDDTAQGNRRSGTYFENYFDERTRWTYAVDAEQYVSDWLGGAHRIKFGINVQQSEYFRDLVRRDQLLKQPNPSAERFLRELGAEATAASVLAHRRFFPGQSANTSQGDVYAVYLNDSYEPRPNLRVNVGVRVSREELSSQGFTPFDPDRERALWRDFLYGEASGGTRSNPSPGSCAGQFYDQGFYNFIRPCLYYFLFDNDMRLEAGPFAFDLPDNGSFTYQPSDLPQSYPAGTPPGALPTGAGFNATLATWLAEAGRLYYADGWDVLSGPPQLIPRGREKYNIVNNSIAPRVSVAWDPWDDGKTKLSANWGRYYQNTFLAPLVDELGPFVSTIFYEQLIDGTKKESVRPYGNPGQQNSAFTISRIDRDLDRQYTDEYGVGIEREIAPETTLSVRYLNRKFYDKLQDRDVNRGPVTWEKAQQVLPLDWLRNRCREPIVIGGVEYADCTGEFDIREGSNFQVQVLEEGDGRPDLEVLSPYYGRVLEISNLNEATYEAYIVELERRYYRNWELRASYTWSEALGQAEEYSQPLGDDLTNTEDEFGPLSYDVRHSVKVSGRLLVPWYGGVRLGGLVTYRTGTPYSIVEQLVVPDFPTFLDEQLPQNLTDPEGNPVEGFPGFGSSKVRTFYPTGSRNDQRNPPVWNVDINAQKEFMIRDVRATVQFDIFNLLNDDTLQTFLVFRENTDVNDDGVVEDDEFRDTPVAIRRQGRQFQLALKLRF